MMAFLAIAGNAVWGQTTGSGTENDPWSIDIGFMYNKSTAPAGITTDAYVTTPWTTTEGNDAYSNKLEIKKGGYYKLSGEESNIQIKVSATDSPVYITLDGKIHVDASLDNKVKDPQNGGSGVWADRCAMEIVSDADVTLYWTNNNCEFSSGGDRAGINVKPGATLRLEGKGTGTLTGTCWNNQNGVYTTGAGIGGDDVEPDFGTIIIENGTVVGRCFAQVNGWQAYGAGIGGGFTQGTPNPVDNGTASAEGTIIIKGGTVTGTRAYTSNVTDNHFTTDGISAAIGGGYKGTCTNIAILGGTVTTSGTADGADDIGVGKDYSNGITKGIIIGQWDKETTPNIASGTTINDDNIVKGADGSLVGTVTMPEGTQMYVPNAPIVATEGNSYYAYNYTLSDGKLGDEASHNPTMPAEVADKFCYYYGPGMSFTVPDMSCSENHLFLGWYEDDDNLVASDKGSSTFEVPNTALTAPVDYAYSPVWVDNEYSITVKTGTEWKKDGENTPEIAYSPDGTSDVLDKLNFEFTTNPLPAELTGLQFDGNQLIGTPKLQGNDTYKKCDLKATVSLDNGTKQEIAISITIVDEIMINSIEVASTNHIYNGKLHNGTQGGGVDEDYVLEVKMTHDIDGKELNKPEILREGVHYRIYKYNFEGGEEQKAEGSTQSLPIKNAGTYSNITIQAIDAVLTDDQYMPIAGGIKNLGNATIVVAQRPMNISISFNKQSIEEDEELTWDDVTVTPQALEGNSGIVAKDKEDFKKAVTGKITYTLNEEGTIATVKIYDVAVADQGEFLVSNYDLTINGDSYREGMDVDLDDPEIPVASSSTGGSFNDHRYQLFLANKDYLKTDVKTVEYYEKLGLELFSRHNKKYTDAGGSFTVWYEKDGEANVGGYRLFWSKSGEHGDYQEVKFDPVSEYFRIDNVHSDVYVKIYDADGFPVANEAITAQDFRAYAQPNKIIVITPEPTDVQIISMAGAVVAADKVTGQREFANLAEGVYIVRMGETIVKLQVRN